MSDFMSDYRRQLVTIRCRLDQPTVDIDSPAWKTEGIDFFRIDDAKPISQIRQRMILNEPLAYRPEIVIEAWITHQRQRLLCLFCRLGSDLDILFEGKEIYTAAVCQEQEDSQQNFRHS